VYDQRAREHPVAIAAVIDAQTKVAGLYIGFEAVNDQAMFLQTESRS